MGGNNKDAFNYYWNKKLGIFILSILRIILMLRTTWSYDRNNILLAENLGEFYKKATTILFILNLSYDHEKNV